MDDVSNALVGKTMNARWDADQDVGNPDLLDSRTQGGNNDYNYSPNTVSFIDASAIAEFSLHLVTFVNECRREDQ